MKSLSQYRIVFGLGLILMLGVAALALPQQQQTRSTRQVDQKDLDEAAEEARNSSKVLEEIMGAPDKAIPKDLLDKAKAIAVFSNVTKAAFIVGGQGGDGVVSRRTAKGWSPPVFIELKGGSFGAQIGAQSTDYVLLFMNDDAVRELMKDEFEIGGEASVSAGPVGRTAAASTNVTLDAQILSYSRSKGVFAGVSLKGAKISAEDDLNRAVYGMEAKEIFKLDPDQFAAGSSDFRLPADVTAFQQTIARYSSGR